MLDSSSARPGLRIGALALFVLLGVAGLYGWRIASSDEAAESQSRAEEPASARPTQTAPPRQPAVRIPESGRLEVSAEELRDGDVLALGLDMSNTSRGEARILPVKLVDATGRVLELAAVSLGESGGVRLEIDPDWLTPGRYLIQIESAGPGPLPLLRYVLEVR